MKLVRSLPDTGYLAKYLYGYRIFERTALSWLDIRPIYCEGWIFGRIQDMWLNIRTDAGYLVLHIRYHTGYSAAYQISGKISERIPKFVTRYSADEIFCRIQELVKYQLSWKLLSCLSSIKKNCQISGITFLF